MKKAVITGIFGQDGQYLAELLFKKEYAVYGWGKKPDRFPNDSFASCPGLVLRQGDINDAQGLAAFLREVAPDEIYHLAAESSVAQSFLDPIRTLTTNINGTANILETLKKDLPSCRFYFAASSEMFGGAGKSPQNEGTPFSPLSPYAVSKVAGFHLTNMYRKMSGLFACSGILFNHESPRRGIDFVTRKITREAIEISRGERARMKLGNLDAKRDWGYAPEYVEAMWRMLQAPTADDFVIATGEGHTVREFVTRAFVCVDIVIEWKGERVKEQGIDSRSGAVLVEVDPHYLRPADATQTLGDYSKAKEILGWEPKVKFDDLVGIMMDAELNANR